MSKPLHVPSLLRATMLSACAIADARSSNRKLVRSAWLFSSNIDDLCLKKLARVDRAVLTVTPLTPPPYCHVSFSLYRLCLLKAKITPEIGWGRVNVGQELLVLTWASQNSPNVPKTAVSSQKALERPPVEAGTQRIKSRSRMLPSGLGGLLLFTTLFLVLDRWAEWKTAVVNMQGIRLWGHSVFDITLITCSGFQFYLPVAVILNSP